MVEVSLMYGRSIVEVPDQVLAEGMQREGAVLCGS